VVPPAQAVNKEKTMHIDQRLNEKPFTVGACLLLVSLGNTSSLHPKLLYYWMNRIAIVRFGNRCLTPL
jgi:hypothetical protein